MQDAEAGRNQRIPWPSEAGAARISILAQHAASANFCPAIVRKRLSTGRMVGPALANVSGAPQCATSIVTATKGPKVIPAASLLRPSLVAGTACTGVVLLAYLGLMQANNWRSFPVQPRLTEGIEPQHLCGSCRLGRGRHSSAHGNLQFLLRRSELADVAQAAKAISSTTWAWRSSP